MLKSFDDFKDTAPARETVRKLLGLEISGMDDWKQYIDAVSRANRDQAFIKRAKDMGHVVSTGEFSVLLAVLWTMDYANLAKEIEDETGRRFISSMRYTTGEHAAAVSAAFALGA